MPGWMRRPPLRGRGHLVVGTICVYELAALPKSSPLPTISDVIQTRRHGWVLGVAMLAGFAAHWWVRFGDDIVAGVVDEFHS